MCIRFSLAVLKQSSGESSQAAPLYAESFRSWPCNAAALLNLAHLFRDTGKIASAMDVYRRVITLNDSLEIRKAWSDQDMEEEQTSCVHAAGYCLCVLLHQIGKGGCKEATELLQKFRCTLKVASNIWKAMPAHDVIKDAKDESKVKLFRSAVPHVLRTALCTAFAPKSLFWEETDYASRCEVFVFHFLSLALNL